MKTRKIFIGLLVLTLTLFSCSENLNNDVDIEDEEVTTLSKNSIKSEYGSGEFNYYSYTSYSLSNGEVFDFTVVEKVPTSFQNLDYGNYIRIFIKDLPTQDKIYQHRPDANFDLEDDEYYLTNARIGASGSQEWYGPYINTRTTAELSVTFANGVATFTVIDAELSDNYVAPISSTEKFSLSFSINASELVDANVNTFTDLAN